MQQNGQELVLSSFVSPSYVNLPDEESAYKTSYSTQRTQESFNTSPAKPSTRYIGNSLVFGWYKNKPLCSIGPNWCLFLFAWMYLIAGGTVFYLSAIVNESYFIKVFALGLIIWQGFIYMLTALKNPGLIITPEHNDLELHKTTENRRFCAKCNIIRDSTTVHCSACDVCIKGYDHHCPWTGKCIGSGNIYPFYIFLISTGIYFVFFTLFALYYVSKN